MTHTHIEAAFEVTQWDESVLDEGDGDGRLTEALVSKTYTGAIEGTSLTKWLMVYAPDQTATFVGIERVRGSIDGRQGSVVLLHDGTFDKGVAEASLRVLSGAEELAAVTGAGTFRADPAGAITLDVDL